MFRQHFHEIQLLLDSKRHAFIDSCIENTSFQAQNCLHAITLKHIRFKYISTLRTLKICKGSMAMCIKPIQLTFVMKYLLGQQEKQEWKSRKRIEVKQKQYVLKYIFHISCNNYIFLLNNLVQCVLLLWSVMFVVQLDIFILTFLNVNM